jgi:hypothetical protein
MPFADIYRRQAMLLIRLLPVIAEEKCFALKGGTAINLFERNMPRLSVDIVGNMPAAHRQFLVSFERGEPDWTKLGLPAAVALPAVKWRQHNLDKLSPEKRAALVANLERYWPSDASPRQRSDRRPQPRTKLETTCVTRCLRQAIPWP